MTEAENDAFATATPFNLDEYCYERRTNCVTRCTYCRRYEFICLYFVVGLDRNSGLHRLRSYCPSPGCRALVCDTDSDFVCNYGLDSKRFLAYTHRLAI